MKTLPFIAGALLAGAAPAQNFAVKPLLDARLRYENVDQDGIARNADALTLRVRPGLQVSRAGWSALVEGEATLAIVDDYNDGTNGKTAFPNVIDPRNAELNRAQIRYTGKQGFAVTAGRQLLELADQRFVGSSNFRQNQQTFDAVRLQWGTAKGFSADLAYAWSDRTVNGRRGTGVRQQAVRGDNVFALLNYGTKAGTLTGFAYLVDQDEAAVQGFRLSSQTYGVRFAGSQPLRRGVKLGYIASWARQSDYHHNPNDYSADYRLVEGSLAIAALTAKAGYEVLGADRGLALTSVQTPLASLFPWQGWADKFTTTPPNGVRDLYGTLRYGWKKVGPADSITLTASYHRFDSDRLSQHYGDEWDLLASAKRGRATMSVRYARYEADRFATNTNKAWLEADWTF
ncbi:alginate export family protein [Sphingomonas crusticola]|uniref:alginate export family protein n=1 Tax=Sphingomonas crusticola TaxID=1697973 RepID=UPI000E24E673|nr:alginate export family protein [Sphingomonas crusticola]